MGRRSARAAPIKLLWLVGGFAQALGTTPGCKKSPQPIPEASIGPARSAGASGVAFSSSKTLPVQSVAISCPTDSSAAPAGSARPDTTQSSAAHEPDLPIVADPPARTAVTDGPSARTVDTPRDAIIEQVRLLVQSCHRVTGSKGKGRVRVVLRLRSTGKTKSVDVTTSGRLPHQLGSCCEASIRAVTFRMRADTPHFLSFPVLLPS